MPALDPANFDAARPIVMARDNVVGGHGLRSGETITIVDADEPDGRGEVTLDQAKRLWARGLFVYADAVRPTPVESPQDAARRTIAVEPIEGGKWMIRAPWLTEPETVADEEAANLRRDELIAAGHPHPDDAPAVVIQQPGGEPPANPAPRFKLTETGNGYFEITGPGLDEPEKVRGRVAAETRQSELEAAFKEE